MALLDRQPRFQGRLVSLRPLMAEDFENLYLAAADPLSWEQHPEKNRYQREVFKKFFLGALESKGAFAVMDTKTKTVIGSTRFINYDEAQSRVEIGYTFLARAYWAQGHNPE